MTLLFSFHRVSCAVPGEHTPADILEFAAAMLSSNPELSGCFVEAGSYMGAGTAKFSLAARLANRKLVVFDSFMGIPENSEQHGKNIFGGAAGFGGGDYCGTLEEVTGNLARYGSPTSCDLVPGWFEETLPNFDRPILAAYIDVDLVSSTADLLEVLFPLLQPGGVLFSQDGHLPLIIDLLDDDRFWRDEVGCAKPRWKAWVSGSSLGSLSPAFEGLPSVTARSHQRASTNAHGRRGCHSYEATPRVAREFF